MKHTPISRVITCATLTGALTLAAVSLTACSIYQGPVTNTPQAAATGGLPGMTRDSAP